MKKLLFLLFLAFSVLFTASPTISAASKSKKTQTKTESVSTKSFAERLRALKGVTSVTKVESNKFPECYEVMITQPLDHKNPKTGMFQQRFIVSHVSDTAPTVMTTEGYGGAYGLNPSFRDELSTRFNANSVLVEHRFFLKSMPQPRDWQYLNAENAAGDLHNINQLMKSIYKGKWIATGISKGGQTTMFYRTFYPNDVDISVPYVGPICFGIEDGRHEPFIDRCGRASERDSILSFQREVLRRKATLAPMLKDMGEKRGLKFFVSPEETLDYLVLEYPFSIWQWGTPVKNIPTLDSSDEVLFKHLISIVGPDYFSHNNEPSFYVQAARELGYYGYDIKPFEGLLTIKTAKNYLHDLMLPDDAKNITFDHSLHRKMYNYLKNNDPKMIAIYGEFDPWSAVAPADSLFEGKKNMKIYFEPRGSHRARISTMPAETQKEIWDTLEKWLKE